jgi:hypothetical protein
MNLSSDSPRLHENVAVYEASFRQYNKYIAHYSIASLHEIRLPGSNLPLYYIV